VYKSWSYTISATLCTSYTTYLFYLLVEVFLGRGWTVYRIQFCYGLQRAVTFSPELVQLSSQPRHQKSCSCDSFNLSPFPSSVFCPISQNFEKRLLASSFTSVRPHGTARLPMNGFSLNLIFGIFRKSIGKIHVPLKSDNNNGYFKWWPLYIYDNISLNSSYNEKCFRQICT
jgi:hypothetical protein